MRVWFYALVVEFTNKSWKTPPLPNKYMYLFYIDLFCSLKKCMLYNASSIWQNFTFLISLHYHEPVPFLKQQQKFTDFSDFILNIWGMEMQWNGPVLLPPDAKQPSINSFVCKKEQNNRMEMLLLTCTERYTFTSKKWRQSTLCNSLSGKIVLCFPLDCRQCLRQGTCEKNPKTFSS